MCLPSVPLPDNSRFERSAIVQSLPEPRVQHSPFLRFYAYFFLLGMALLDISPYLSEVRSAVKRWLPFAACVGSQRQTAEGGWKTWKLKLARSPLCCSRALWVCRRGWVRDAEPEGGRQPGTPHQQLPGGLLCHHL